MSNDVPTGRARGGRATAAKMTEAERVDRAKKGAAARWDTSVPVATHGSVDKPLDICGIKIPCYVLSDGRRVLHHRGMVSALGMARGGSSKGGGDRLAHFVGGKALNPFISSELASVTTEPIKFKAPNGQAAYGYEATVLADICDAVFEANKQGKLQAQQAHIAARCELLLRGFARVGIIALVDEATGYQKDRAKNALADILETFVAKELQPWVKTFPSEFYEHMFRLRGLDFHGDTVKRPQYFGCLTNDIIYRRLAPGVWLELKQRVKKRPSGRLTHHLHRRLTTESGHPKLKELVVSVTTIMKLSTTWMDFKEKIDIVHPAYDKTMLVPPELAGDDGTGI